MSIRGGTRATRDEHQTTLLSLPHAAVEAGLGTLGLNLQLLTPEFGPRVLLTAVLCSVDVECDQPMDRQRCASARAAGAASRPVPAMRSGIGTRDWQACDRTARRTASRKLTDHVEQSSVTADAGAEGAAALGDDVQSLAEHPARLGRDHRLPPLRRRLPGRRRLRGDAARRARRDPGGSRPRSASRPPRWRRRKKTDNRGRKLRRARRWIGATRAPDVPLTVRSLRP